MFKRTESNIKKGSKGSQSRAKAEQVQVPLSFRVTKKELRYIKREAKAENLSLSNWIRDSLLIRIAKDEEDKEQSKTKRAKLRSQTELGFE